jgi:hypothetical protein
MLSRIKDIINKTADLGFSLLCLGIAIRQTMKALPGNQKKILFILNDKKLYENDQSNARHIYLILNAFSEAGYTVFIDRKLNFRDYLRSGRYIQLIYTIDNLKVLPEPPADTEGIIYAFDGVDKAMLSLRWKKLAFVNIFKPPLCKVGKLINIPFFMHPLIYFFKQHRRLGQFRDKKRKLRVFFGGNTDKLYYTDAELRRQGQMTRFEALNALINRYSGVKSLKSSKDFTELSGNNKYKNECWILCTDKTQQIASFDWLNKISFSDFFLCFSGAGLPMCHNAIEAMAVGTIPVISYFDWFDPPLEHKKNAIVYSSAEDLLRKIEEILKMGPDEIKEVRRNVADYYDKNLSPQSFVSRFESSADKINTLILFPHLVCSEDETGRYQDLREKLESELLAEANFKGS